jgi:hypothetical protein
MPFEASRLKITRPAVIEMSAPVITDERIERFIREA